MKKNAIFGISKHQQMFLNAVKVISGIQINAFASLEDAKDWVVKE